MGCLLATQRWTVLFLDPNGRKAAGLMESGERQVGVGENAEHWPNASRGDPQEPCEASASPTEDKWNLARAAQ